MRAARLESIGQVTIVDIPRPVIKNPDDVLIKVVVVGVCGSENHAFRGTHPFRKPPVVMGHEMSGIVEDFGTQVKGINRGDRVFVDPQLVCGKCSYCMIGDYNLCPSKIVLGSPGWEGAFGDYVVVPQRTIFHIPDSMTYEQAAMVEPLSVSLHAVKRTHLKKGQSIAILGTGTIGGLAAGVASEFGASQIICVDIHQHCLDAAREGLSATHDFLLPDEDIVAKIRKLTNGEGLDAVIISGDDTSLVNYGLEIIKRQKTIVIAALLTEDPIQFGAHNLVRQEINLIGTYMYNKQDIEEAFQLVKSGKVNVDTIITHRLPLEQTQLGMELSSTKRDNAIKVIINH